MGYSVKPILHKYKDAKDLQKILICVTFNRARIYLTTGYKMTALQFAGDLTNHPHGKQINIQLKQKCNEIEAKIINAMKDTDHLTKQDLTAIIKNNHTGAGYISDYIDELIKDNPYNLSKKRLKIYNVISNKIKLLRPELQFKHITLKILQSFEADIKKGLGNENPKRQKVLDQNTVQNQMSLFKSVLQKASDHKLIKKEQFENYTPPGYIQKIPEYLTEAEINKIHSFVKVCEKPGYKNAGYYFLLSCFAGFRLGDVMAFDYNERVSNGTIILRTNKTKEIVSIPVHERLKDVLKYVKVHPCSMSEQHLRMHVKELCKWCGIKKRIKFHSGRHSWAMLLMAKGFSLEEVARTLGNTPKVAQIYARISNIELSKKIKARL